MRNLISVVVPIFNEAPSLPELHRRLTGVLRPLHTPFELVFVDDGSTDDTRQTLSTLTPLRAIHLKRNYGQTIALATGIESARGDTIIVIDGDLENDPDDIPRLLKKMDEGYDVVSGWRQRRWENAAFRRRLPSLVANYAIARLSGLAIHDFGCTLKAYRAEFLKNIPFSGNMHRLLLAYVARQGAKIIEIPVNFTPRKHGTSHYGAKRILEVPIDMLAYYFFEKYHNRPLYFFGAAGFISFSLSILVFILMLVLRFYGGLTFIQTPLPILAVFFAMIAAQFVLMGLIAELVYRFSKHDRPIAIREYIKDEASRG
ncbi:MAG: glycosyltransferase family 2 protein [Candidatus Vogelbacteria bacterium]|nr:glycosyltransferase family 2 protein [Candidatus Vogelbacteria bacterium]